jgi:hypothetical protein
MSLQIKDVYHMHITKSSFQYCTTLQIISWLQSAMSTTHDYMICYTYEFGNGTQSASIH